MTAIFEPRANIVMRLALVGAGLLPPLFLTMAWFFPLSDYATGAHFVQAQPVPFSHQHHVAGLGLDCRYCHGAVELAADAGMPPTHTCMTCHSQIWTAAPVLAPVRASFLSGEELRWTRVNKLPGYVFFNHSIHVAKGVGCVTCHGAIDEMPLTWKGASFKMSWCLDCHRDPAPRLRPLNEVTNPQWQRTAETPAPAALLAQYHIHPATLADCSVCHR